MEYGKMVKGTVSYNDDDKKNNSGTENNKRNDFDETEAKKKVDRQKVEKYILANKKYFPSSKLLYMKNKMLDLDDKSFDFVSTTKLKSPTKVWLFSIFLGVLGVDRFMVGDIGKGILKLLTFGGCTFLYFYDIFTISGLAKKVNFENVVILL